MQLSRLAGVTGPPEGAWERVATRRFYFAHQSVGANLLEGLQELDRERAGPRLRIVETKRPASVAGPAIVHFRAGRNSDPQSKPRDLLDVLDARPSPDFALVMLKYCYVDMLVDTDAAALFAEYEDFVSEVRRRHGDVTLVHATMPLTTVSTGLRGLVRSALRRDAGHRLNAKRGAYNTLIRRAYAGTEPLFDLAALECMRPDGRRHEFRSGGRRMEALAHEYTSDGGHLNELGRRRAASALVTLLATVQPR